MSSEAAELRARADAVERAEQAARQRVINEAEAETKKRAEAQAAKDRELDAMLQAQIAGMRAWATENGFKPHKMYELLDDAGLLLSGVYAGGEYELKVLRRESASTEVQLSKVRVRRGRGDDGAALLAEAVRVARGGGE